MIGPVALLLWLLTAGVVLGALAGGAFAAITRRPAWIPWIAGAAFVWLAAYGALLIGVSLAGEEQILENGEVESFCGVYLDCHMGVEVAGVRKAEVLGSAATSTRGNFWVVTVRVSNTARRVPLRIHAPVARVIDDAGRKYGPSEQGQRALAGPGRPPTTLDREVSAGGSYSAEIVFDLPMEVHDPRLVITSDVWVDRAAELFLIGDVDSFLHSPAVHRLVRGDAPG